VAQVEVRDYALWIKHIHGSDALRRDLEALEPGQTVGLRVDGKTGMWRKMKPNKTGRYNVPGLAPIGEAKAHWGNLFRRHRPHGAVVDIERAEGADVSSSSGASAGPAPRWEMASEAEREAAWEAFKALSKAGWRSEGPYGPRDELYERDEP
jgi:hypothetical protein